MANETKGDSPRTPSPGTLGMRCGLRRPCRSPSCWDGAVAGPPGTSAVPAVRLGPPLRSGRLASAEPRGTAAGRTRPGAESRPKVQPPGPVRNCGEVTAAAPGLLRRLSLFRLSEAALQSPAPPAGARSGRSAARPRRRVVRRQIKKR